jgi:hypothetical protein
MIGLFGQGGNIQGVLIANGSFTATARCLISSNLAAWRISKFGGGWVRPPASQQQTEIILLPGEGELIIFSCWDGR